MTKQKALNETIHLINAKEGENTVFKASEMPGIVVKIPAEKPGEDNSYCLSSNEMITQTTQTCKVRNLRESEIECKISAVKEGSGVSILLYKTARTDTAILDEMFGKFGWQCEYKEIKGNMYCGISVFNENRGQWITKWGLRR